MIDQDEVLQSRKPAKLIAKREPRVEFYVGMRLRCDAGTDVGTIEFVSAIVGVDVQWHTHVVTTDRRSLLRDIRDGLVTIEPMIGMRLQPRNGRTSEIESVDGEWVTLREGDSVTTDRHWADICSVVRIGEWAILPPARLGTAEVETNAHVPELEAACVARDERISSTEIELDAWRKATGMPTPELAKARIAGYEAALSVTEERADKAISRAAECVTRGLAAATTDDLLAELRSRVSR